MLANYDLTNPEARDAFLAEIYRVKEKLKQVENIYRDANRELFYVENQKTKFPVWALFLGFIFYVFPLVIMLVMNKNRISKEEKEARKYEITDKAERNVKYILNNLNSSIPSDYLFETCLNYMQNLVVSQRVSTIPQLYDKVDEQIHRWKLEANSNEALRAQLAIAESAKGIAANQNIQTAIDIINLLR